MTKRRLHHSSRLAVVALLNIFAGCGEPAAMTLDMGHGPPDQPITWSDPCDDFGTVTLFRITELSIPTLAEVNAGVPVGHNVDGMGDACGIPDFPGGVDNALIDQSSEPDAPPADGFDVQAAIDAALECAPDADPATCTRLDLILRVGTNPWCARVAIENGEGTTLAGPFVGSVDAAGNFRGEVPWFDLVVPYHGASAQVDIELLIVSVILTATIGETTLTNIVLGGALPSATFEAMLMELLPLEADGPTFEDVQPLLASLYDVPFNDTCSALSVGFTGTATRVTSP